MTHFSQIVTKHLGDFCMNIGHRELSKIAQSGHTGVRVRGVQKVALLATRVLVRNRERENKSSWHSMRVRVIKRERDIVQVSMSANF